MCSEIQFCDIVTEAEILESKTSSNTEMSDFGPKVGHKKGKDKKKQHIFVLTTLTIVRIERGDIYKIRSFIHFCFFLHFSLK